MKFTGVLTVQEDHTEFDFDFFDLDNTTPVDVPSKFSGMESQSVVDRKKFGKDRGEWNRNLIYENKDCIEFLKSLDDKTVDLICTDPPYYRVVNDKWDNQWFTIDEYYSWCEQWITELGRVAKWGCSFWLFGFPQQLSTLLPVIERAGFTFRQQIVINKGMQAVAGRTSSKLKMFPTATESIFFFHYEARDHIRDLLQAERKRLGWKGNDVNAHLGKAYIWRRSICLYGIRKETKRASGLSYSI